MAADPLVTGKLFGRYAQVTFTSITGVQTVLDPALHIQFKCVRSSVSAFPSGLDISITNLSQQTRNQIMEKGSTIALVAGYKQAFGLVFSGNIRTVDHVRRGADWNTVVKCGSGEVAWQFAFSKQSIKGPVDKLAVIKALLLDMKDASGSPIGLGGGTGFSNLRPPFATASSKVAQTSFINGYTYHGNPGKEIVKIAKSLGYDFWIDNNEPVFAPFNTGISLTEIVYVLNPDTGLLGSPEHGSPNAVGAKIGIVKAKCLMLPQLRPGFHIQLQHDLDKKTGKFLSDGIYYIQKMICEGDTAGNEWSCDLELKKSGTI